MGISMNKKAKYKELVDGETGEVKRIKWLAAESELTPTTWDIAWGVDAMELGTSFSVDVHKKGKGQLKVSDLPTLIKPKGKPSHDAMFIAREIQAAVGTVPKFQDAVSCEYVINKGLDGQLNCDQTLRLNRSPRKAE